ncbi:hypothetical protein L9F63_010450, partial [Diploptera punctata]
VRIGLILGLFWCPRIWMLGQLVRRTTQVQLHLMNFATGKPVFLYITVNSDNNIREGFYSTCEVEKCCSNGFYLSIKRDTIFANID